MEMVLLIAIVLLADAAVGSQLVSRDLPPGRPSPMWNNLLLKPEFDNDNRRTVVASVGSTAYLHCKINHLGDRAVTWIRKHDVQILTVGTFTYTTDPRFSAHTNERGDEWVLRITGSTMNDEGGYECQVSTDPKISTTFHLHVVVAYAEMEGQYEQYMNSGGDIDLRCSVPRVTKPPDYILWYHGKKVINYSVRSGVQVFTNRKKKSSRLLIKNAGVADSGNYTCVPSNAKAASVIVHVIQEETPAAIQRGSGESLSANLPNLMCLVVVSLIRFSCF